MRLDAPSILIVDDNEDDLYTLQMLLEADGYERIETASGGRAALELIDGFEVLTLRTARRDTQERWRNLPTSSSWISNCRSWTGGRRRAG